MIDQFLSVSTQLAGSINSFRAKQLHVVAKLLQISKEAPSK
jgi:hypothetical protein